MGYGTHKKSINSSPATSCGLRVVGLYYHNNMSETGKEYAELMAEMRDERYRQFRNITLPRLQHSTEVLSVMEDNNGFTLTTRTYGVIDFFPKADKVRVRRTNRWFGRGDQWLKKNILRCIS